MRSAEETEPKVSWVFTAVISILCWLLSILGPLSWLMLLILAFALVRMNVRKAWLPLTATILINPLCVSFAGGLVEYMGGAPKLRYMGLPRMEFFNVDRETRCFHSTGGCLIYGNEWLFQGSHNLGVFVAAKIFGPPSKSYDGPYPSRDEALVLMASSPNLEIQLLRRGEIRVGKQMIQLDPEVMADLVPQYVMISSAEPESSDDDMDFRAQAVLYQDRCLILRFVDRGMGLDDETDCLVLIDARVRRPFAYYPIKGRGFPHSPRVQYLPEDSR